jgi:lysophospholipase L1-like esterase
MKRLLLINLIRLFALVLLAEGGAAAWVKFAQARFDPKGASIVGEMIYLEGGRAVPHPYLNYIPMPNYHHGDKNPSVTKHNSLGFRGADFPVKKPPGVFRILMLGGSATYGVRILNDSQTIPAQLEEKLRQRGYTQVQVINGGVFGYSTAESLIELQFRGLELSPDMVIMYEGVNDLHNRYVPPALFHGDNRGSVKVWDGGRLPWWTNFYLGKLFVRRLGMLDEFYNFDYLIRPAVYLGHTAKGSVTNGVNYVELLKQNTPVFYLQNLLSMYAICKIRGIQLVLASYGYSLEMSEGGYLRTKNYLAGLNQTNDAARTFAKKYSLPFLDFQAEVPKDAKYWSDEFHMNETGAPLGAEVFSAFLSKSRLIPLPRGR